MAEARYIGDMERIKRDFTHHPPNEDQVERYERLRDKGHELAHLIVVACPGSRERSIALTKLQEAIMWANCSIAVNEAEE